MANFEDLDTQKGFWKWELVRLILGVSVFLLASFIFVLGFTEEGIRCCIAWSAKISFSLFCIAFSASAAHLLIRNSFSYWWVFNRKYFGICFAIMHLVHLGFLLILQQVFHPVLD